MVCLYDERSHNSIEKRVGNLKCCSATRNRVCHDEENSLEFNTTYTNTYREDCYYNVYS
jgi:hypothetical protein